MFDHFGSARLRPAVALVVSAVVAGSLVAATTTHAAFRPGDVGFSIRTPSGQAWIYGDSWINGFFIRNAITVNGVYTGSIRGLERGTWVWPGAPFMLPGGKIGMYAAEVTQVKPGMWGFKVLGGVRVECSPTRPWSAKVVRMPRPGMIWAAAATRDESGTIVYAVDSRHHVHAGRPQADGTVAEIGLVGGMISGQFSVVRDSGGTWWMVGQAPHLSRRVIAYRLTGPAGRTVGKPLRLTTLPSPGPTRFAYGATIHPELGGLLTWAVNGHGPGTPYVLQRFDAFWPSALESLSAQPLPAAATPGTAATGTAGSCPTPEVAGVSP